MKKRQELILNTLNELGGEATMREIAKAAGLHVNGVSQSLGAGALSGFIQRVEHGEKWKGPEEVFKLVPQEPKEVSPLVGDQELLF